ncbi:hypothetical protein MBLNU457_7834t2 [Dothideomycetes sp. NU457]
MPSWASVWRHLLCAAPLFTSLLFLLFSHQSAVDQQDVPQAYYDFQRPQAHIRPRTIASAIAQLDQMRERLASFSKDDTIHWPQLADRGRQLQDQCEKITRRLQAGTSDFRYLLITDRILDELQTLRDAARMPDWRWSCSAFAATEASLSTMRQNTNAVLRALDDASEYCWDLSTAAVSDYTAVQQSLRLSDTQLQWKLFFRSTSTLQRIDRIKQEWGDTVAMLGQELLTVCGLIDGERTDVQRIHATMLEFGIMIEQGLQSGNCNPNLVRRLEEQYSTSATPLLLQARRRYTERWT